MAIEKTVKVHQVRVLDDGQIQSHETHTVVDNGVEQGSYNHVRTIEVGDDVAAESEMVRDIAGSVHTPARKAARQARLQAANKPLD